MRNSLDNPHHQNFYAVEVFPSLDKRWVWNDMAFVVAPVGYPVFESVHGDFELVECVGVGNSDVAFAECV